MRRIGLLFFTLALAGCSPAKDGTNVAAQITAFHQKLDQGQSEAIYESAGPEFQSAKPKADLIRFLDAIHRKLGPLKSTQQQGWQDNVNGAGHIYVANYASVYAAGPATETFTYRLGQGAPVLVGYHINADALVVD
jgi:hypothetical protein